MGVSNVITIRPLSGVRARVFTRGVLVAAFVLGALGAAGASATTTSPGTSTQVAALVKASVKITKLTPTLDAALSTAPGEIADFAYKIPALCVTTTACIYGDVSATKTIVLFGNSHARMWLPAIDPIVTSMGYKLVLLGKNSCPVVSLNLSSKIYPECNAVIAESIAAIKVIKPTVAILADRTIEAGMAGSTWEKGMETTIKDITSSVGKVVLIGDIQEFNFNPDSCLIRHPTKVQSACSIANPNHKEPSIAVYEKDAAAKEKADYLNPNQWLCTTTRCSPVIGTFVVYWDSDHVTDIYSAYLSTVMGAALKPIITKA
jgi:hypothetical protein